MILHSHWAWHFLTRLGSTHSRGGPSQSRWGWAPLPATPHFNHWITPIWYSHSCCTGRCWTTWSTGGRAERWRAWPEGRWRPSCRPRRGPWGWCRWSAGASTRWTPAPPNTQQGSSLRCWAGRTQTGRTRTENLHYNITNSYNVLPLPPPPWLLLPPPPHHHYYYYYDLSFNQSSKPQNAWN